MKEIEVTCKLGKELSVDEIKAAAVKALGVSPKIKDQLKYRIVRRSIDARNDVLYRYRIEVAKPEETLGEYALEDYKDVSSAEPVVVIGSGPAGMFAALKLLMRGFKPIILERGKDVHKRKFDMAKLSKEGVVNGDSNYCFGEGGAGTFSDGKLYTRSSKRGDIREVLHQLVRFGADPTILIDAHPHIGSDKLPIVVENIRNCIVEHGGEYHFDSRVTDIVKKGDGSFDVIVTPTEGSGNPVTYSSRKVILATGHSARDIYSMLDRSGVRLEAKPFAMGVRIEHPQRLINSIQYHNSEQMEYLPAASYSLVQQVGGRGVYSFCMCPGGFIVPAMTDECESVVNGMSPSHRGSPFANSGFVTEIRHEDFAHLEPQFGQLAGLEFQRQFEVMARAEANGHQTAPAQRVADFVAGRGSASLPSCSYVPGIVPSRLDKWMPEFIGSRLREAIRIFDRRMRGYLTNEAVVVGVESRTSTPVRIPRDRQSLEHPEIAALYPAGEGAGYAGGIISAALDGERIAEAIAMNTK